MVTRRYLIAVLTAAVATVSVVAAQTPVFDFTIPRISSPRIDGELTDLVWTEASQLGGKIVIDLDNAGYSRVKRPRVGSTCSIRFGLAQRKEPHRLRINAPSTHRPCTHDL